MLRSCNEWQVLKDIQCNMKYIGVKVFQISKWSQIYYLNNILQNNWLIQHQLCHYSDRHSTLTFVRCVPYYPIITLLFRYIRFPKYHLKYHITLLQKQEELPRWRRSGRGGCGSGRVRPERLDARQEGAEGGVHEAAARGKLFINLAFSPLFVCFGGFVWFAGAWLGRR